MTVAGQASAAIMQAVYQGSITDPTSIDTTGVFGAAGANLVGQAFTATYRYDTTLGDYIPFGDGGVLGFWRYGGTPLPAFGNPPGPTSPMLDASLLINGVTVTLGGSYAGLDYRFGKTNANIIHGAASDPANYFLSYLYGVATLTTDDNASFAASGDPGSAEFHYQVLDPTTSALTAGFLLKGVDNIIEVSCVRDCGVAVVPEPATWAMMMAGLFSLGGALRKRRTAGRGRVPAFGLTVSA
jgi:hypothetical protein